MEIPKIPRSLDELKAEATPANLETYAFMWSEARLLLGAAALLAGGVPVLQMFLPFSFLHALTSLILSVVWIVSGVCSAYLAYLWHKAGQKVFGGDDMKDKVAFLVSVVTGLNLGFTGLSGINMGMTLFSNRLIFGLTAIVYVAAAAYLYKRWAANGKKLF
jgi:hypothetical protein